MSTKRVIILRGISGSGKSTFAKRFPHATRVSADDYFESDNGYLFDPTKLPLAHQDCQRRFFEAISREDKTVVVDNTNTTIRDISDYVLPAEALGYVVQIITLDVDPEVAIKRNVHNVSAHTVYNQHMCLLQEEEQFPKSWKHMIINQ